MGRWWRAVKLARAGGGADEVLWELVPAAMRPGLRRLRRADQLDDGRQWAHAPCQRLTLVLHTGQAPHP
jgi:hypothetical protein